MSSENGTHAATAQHAPTRETMTVACQTVLTKNVKNLDAIGVTSNVNDSSDRRDGDESVLT